MYARYTQASGSRLKSVNYVFLAPNHLLTSSSSSLVCFVTGPGIPDMNPFVPNSLLETSPIDMIAKASLPKSSLLLPHVLNTLG